jgi:ribosomal protein S27E
MVQGLLFSPGVTSSVTEGSGEAMRRELQLSVEPVKPNHRSLRRCYGCGNYARPFVEMEGVIRCERCAKKSSSSPDGEDEDVERIEGYGAIV